MLAHLLKATKGQIVSLELLGDVATASPSGETTVEETKSRTTRGNPIANRSVELWKTLRNWLVAVRSGELDSQNTRFTIHTSRRFTGSIAESFHAAQTEAEAAAALGAAAKEFGEGGSGRRVPEALKPHLQEVLSDAARDHMHAIIRAFSIESGTPLSKDELLSLLSNKAVGAEALKPVLLQLLGWVKDRTDESIAQGRSPVISHEAFSLELLAVVRKFDRHQILVSFAPRPTESAISGHLDTRVYVEQLELIETPLDEKLAAISDFLRAEADRITWAAEGLVHESTYDELESDLINAWSAYRTRVEIGASAKTEIERGRLLYADCRLHNVLLQGMAPPPHLARGCFHALSDARKLGWHPDFAARLGAGT
jgi:hypothetical protein